MFDNNYKKYSEEIKNLYLQAFPKIERRPLGQIKDLLEKKKCQILSILYQGDFAGFFILLKHKNARLIDYFAIKKDLRGKSIGSKALKKLDDGNPLLIEIEPIDQKSANNHQRIKRKSFYQSLGFESKDVLVDWYDTTFELMSLNDSKSYESYFNLLDAIFTKEERIKNIRLAS
ncbi:MAG: GNAT family N-acetyltransferase [Anaerococcus sp.]|nr:GNAT family N-acetyltransferase [Anaerococcus sp.]